MTSKIHKSAEPTTELPKQGFIRIKPCASFLNIHHQTLRRWWKNDLFPKPHKINGMVLFKNSEVLEWIDNQISVTE